LDLNETEFEISIRNNNPLMRRKSSRMAMIALAMAGGLVCMGATARRFEPYTYQEITDLELDLMQQGFVATGFDSDVAILGPGFFKVQLPGPRSGGAGYTRCGSLFLDAHHRLAVCAGDNVYPISPVIQLPPAAAQLAIASDGTVQYAIGRFGTVQTAGRVLLYSFANPSGLKPVSNSVFLRTNLSGTPVAGFPDARGSGLLQPGFLSRSEVSRGQ
jgi:flagellar basal body rod protein FlgG